MLHSPGNRFLDPYKILVGAGFKPGMVVGDFGAGNGFYAAAAAKAVGQSGKIYAVDVQDPPLEHIAAESRFRGWHNVITIRANLEKPDSCPVPPVSCDGVILANIMHQANDKRGVAMSTYRALKTGGIALIIEWEPQASPFGPPVEERVSEKDIADIFINCGFKPGRNIPTDPYHYAVTYIK